MNQFFFFYFLWVNLFLYIFFFEIYPITSVLVIGFDKTCVGGGGGGQEEQRRPRPLGPSQPGPLELSPEVLRQG